MDTANPYVATAGGVDRQITTPKRLGLARLAYIPVFAFGSALGFIAGFSIEDGFVAAMKECVSQPMLLAVNVLMFSFLGFIQWCVMQWVCGYARLLTLSLRGIVAGFLCAFLIVAMNDIIELISRWGILQVHIISEWPLNAVFSVVLLVTLASELVMASLLQRRGITNG